MYNPQEMILLGVNVKNKTGLMTTQLDFSTPAAVDGTNGTITYSGVSPYFKKVKITYAKSDIGKLFNGFSPRINASKDQSLFSLMSEFIQLNQLKGISANDFVSEIDTISDDVESIKVSVLPSCAFYHGELELTILR